METNNGRRAYIIQATPETLDAIAAKLLPVSDRDASVAIYNAKPLDLEALRVVVEEEAAAEESANGRCKREGGRN